MSSIKVRWNSPPASKRLIKNAFIKEGAVLLILLLPMILMRLRLNIQSGTWCPVPWIIKVPCLRWHPRRWQDINMQTWQGFQGTSLSILARQFWWNIKGSALLQRRMPRDWLLSRSPRVHKRWCGRADRGRERSESLCDALKKYFYFFYPFPKLSHLYAGNELPLGYGHLTTLITSYEDCNVTLLHLITVSVVIATWHDRGITAAKYPSLLAFWLQVTTCMHWPKL